MSGRLGSGTYARMRNNAEDAVGGQLGDLATQIYGGAYENERGRQMQALQFFEQDMVGIEGYDSAIL